MVVRSESIECEPFMEALDYQKQIGVLVNLGSYRTLVDNGGSRSTNIGSILSIFHEDWEKNIMCSVKEGAKCFLEKKWNFFTTTQSFLEMVVGYKKE